jgi:DNA-binding CsgD family transcriptional regulator
MNRPYCSFLVRFRKVGAGQRFEIEHIQSGEKELLSSLADLTAWLDTHSIESTWDGPLADAREPSSPSSVKQPWTGTQAANRGDIATPPSLDVDMGNAVVVRALSDLIGTQLDALGQIAQRLGLFPTLAVANYGALEAPQLAGDADHNPGSAAPRARLGRADRNEARAAAVALTQPEVSGVRPDNVLTPHPARLTAREIEVLRLLAAGHTNRQIAAALSLSEHTVHVHVRHIFEKTCTDNRAAATAFAFRHGLA